jgi:hypothetical protein
MWVAINQEAPIAGDVFALYAVIGMPSGVGLKIPQTGPSWEDLGDATVRDLGITEIHKD